jgi:hypothetical protein
MPPTAKAPIVAAAAVLFAMAPPPLPAQVVRGTLVEQGTGLPVPGTPVVLVDAAGRPQQTVLTDASGAFVVRGPAPGRYVLRAERVGYRVAVSPPLELAAGELREYRMVAPFEAVALEGIVVEGRSRRCVLRPREGAEVARVWEEARKALTATAVSQRQQALRYEVVQYERDLDPKTLRVRSEKRRSKTQLARHPFASLPAEDLQEKGYVRSTSEGTFFYGPDAGVLLSDAFLDDHCFRLQKGKGQDTLIGLTFEPVRGRKVPEVEGVLWLDKKSAELRHLEYSYDGLPAHVPTGASGGRVEFERLPTGLWIVSRWWIRMPAFRSAGGERWQAVASVPGTLGALRRESISPRAVLTGIKQEGGEVLSVLTPTGEAAWRRTGNATLVGTVFDSTRMAPLAGARVYLEGTPFFATTDEQGRFQLRGLPEAEYTASFTHPLLRQVGFRPVPRAVSPRSDESSAVELATPSPRTALRALCPSAPTKERTGVLLGRVRDATGGVPPVPVRVEISWVEYSAGGASGIMATRRTAVAEADTAGFYRICGIPTDLPLTAQVHRDGYEGPAVSLRAGRGELAVQDLVSRDGEPMAANGAMAAPGGSPDLRASGRGEPVELEGVTVVSAARPRSSQLREFYRRKKTVVSGYFVTREEIETRRGYAFLDLLRGVPNLDLVRNQDGSMGLRVKRALASLWDRDCPPQFFLDGNPYDVTGDPNAHFRTAEIEGVEVYTGANVPAQFGGSKAACGVIAVWTRERA